MPTRIPDTLFSLAAKRRSTDSSRHVREVGGRIDVSSNDYLGLARTVGRSLQQDQRLLEVLSGQLGATGSRLVTGHSAAHDELECFVAGFHQAEAALLFGSGYEANIGLLSSIAGRGDTILYDELVHASMRDGIRLSHARSFSFRHNDIDDLLKKLTNSRGECFIAVESLYSMDGDHAPLEDLCRVADEYGAFLIVDEAHSTGLYGTEGQGRVFELGLHKRVFARIHTFGKALGYRGACVVGPVVLREHLINSARPFIYSTAPDKLSLILTFEAYRLMACAHAERSKLQQLITWWRHHIAALEGLLFLPSNSPIQGLLVPGNSAVTQIEQVLLDHGFFVRAIRSPTVPQGQERIRICLHSFNSIEELETATAVMHKHIALGAVA